jgi:GNAT superfamily N-acetyltransferase
MSEPRSRARLSIREVESDRDPAFRAAHALLRRTFPRAELLSRREWADVMRERNQGLWTDLNWHLLVASRQDQVVGTASGSYVGNRNVGMVGYIAVRPAERGRGVGQRLRRALHDAFEEDASRVHGRRLAAIIGEVRPDNPWLRHIVRHDGAIALDFPYYQPSVAWLRRPVPLVLYYQPLGEARRSLATTEVRRLVYTIWRRVYRVGKPLSSGVFRRMMRALTGRQRVGQLELPAP